MRRDVRLDVRLCVPERAPRTPDGALRVGPRRPSGVLREAGAIAHIKLSGWWEGASSPASGRISVTPVTSRCACHSSRRCGKGVAASPERGTFAPGRLSGVPRLLDEPQQPVADRTVPGEVAVARRRGEVGTQQRSRLVPDAHGPPALGAGGRRHGAQHLPLTGVPLARVAVKDGKREGPDPMDPGLQMMRS